MSQKRQKIHKKWWQKSAGDFPEYHTAQQGSLSLSIFRCFFGEAQLLRSPLDGGVDGQHDYEQDQPIEHAEDWGPTVIRVFLGTWKIERLTFCVMSRYILVYNKERDSNIKQDWVSSVEFPFKA